MKAFTLAGLRLSTGLLLLIWGLVKISAPGAAVGVSDKYYGGTLSAEMLQMPLGIAQVVLALLVIIGLFRRIVLPLQAIVLGIGLLAIWQYILDPLGLYLLTEDTRQLLFFPSLGIFFASLVLIAFRSDDRLALDTIISKK
jgi:uncharacterized membrane protein YphA (DoxX/SURF4 family)